ncbi:MULTISPECIES: ABC transporter permease [Acetobacteraceae]|uniref:ABC transporter n=1 Tax=Acetobacter tropicalis TaxID=104102 RepID=A0A511FS24_9PROT|nr:MULTISPECIES: ABC transporter permease subunit [Acetobacteraceae]KXV51467.1 hypothetical protein AD944_01740 [Acetobacter tropicalis]GAL98765.1 binding-protein-dependent transporters inner membrane component [Acetobacter tropicalis]GBR70740.1 ABC transporter-like protein permease [Acetobacter tropicalis NRIC 0312]GEL51753.1 ABC transporter [Acetobacter tropicalis]GEL65570.1 ABC transporter [Kozakia baliensis]
MKRFLARWWGPCLLLLAWQVGVQASGVNQIVMPHPMAVLMDMASNPLVYGRAAAGTLLVAVPGLTAGLAMGGMLALLCQFSAVMEYLLTPLAMMLSSIPVVAIIPVLSRLFGYHMTTLIIIVAIICFLPAFVYMHAGLRSVPAGSLDVFSVFGAGARARLLLLRLPASVPSCMTALRIAAPTAILASLTAEYLMQTGGLGALFRITTAEFRSERAFGCSLVAMVLSVCCFFLALHAERAVTRRWR